MQGFQKPKKMDLIPPVTPCTTQSEWEKHIQSAFTQFRKYMQKSESWKSIMVPAIQTTSSKTIVNMV